MKHLTLSIALACSALSLNAQQAEPFLSPQVQKGQLQTKYITSPRSFKLTVDAKRQNTYPMRNIVSWASLSAVKGEGFPLVLGVRGDKSVRSVEKLIPQKTEGYYLSVSPKGITIAGQDERGLFYGLQTLRQMMSDGKIAEGTITDYPDVPYRGVVEGFYGTPWSFEDRLSQFKFYGRNKLNVYIYGPKDDPYHSVPKWRQAYPENEAKQIAQLVKTAGDNGVIFYWAIHPGQDIKWNDEDRALLLEKFESMYRLGVRGFAVFFDDISGEGTKADKQAELLNYIDGHFIKPKGDIAPLIMCPTEYNKAWSNIQKGYLPTLGDKLNKDIEVMWTGNTVVSCLDKPDVVWINQHIKRKAYIWFNFPVTDFVRDHLLMGKTYGNSLEIADDVSGFLSNPMEHAEASKMALFSVADYTWNMKAYDTERSWELAPSEVFPENPDALLRFAHHSSALGSNGHRFDRKESEELQPVLEKIIQGTASDEDFKTIRTECSRIESASNMLLGSTSNPALISEMKPWLRMAKLVAEYGQLVLAPRESTDEQAFMAYYQEARALQRMMYLLDIEANQNPYQPGVKYGSQWLLPALNICFKRDVDVFNRKYNGTLSKETSYMPFELTSSVEAFKHQPLLSRGNQVMISPSNEVVRWNPNDVITLRAKQGEVVENFSADMGVQGSESLFKLEVLVGQEWKELALKQSHGTSVGHDGLLADSKVSAIRWIFIGSTPTEFRLRAFRFSTK